MGAGQQAGLEFLFAMGECALKIECADDAILCGTERQVDHRHFGLYGLALGAGGEARRLGFLLCLLIDFLHLLAQKLSEEACAMQELVQLLEF
jgi:hypothetical protein